MSYNIEKIRADFPALDIKIHDKYPLIYLDNAATTQKPKHMLDAEYIAYTTRNANIHRGVHTLSQQATMAHESAREVIARFINAREAAEVLFTRGTTEGINMVASIFCSSQMQAGDEVILSAMEHHSNIVPWQLQAEARGIKIKVVPCFDNGELDMGAMKSMFTDRTKLVSICYASNVLGTVNPVKEVIALAHSHGVPVLLDAAQAIAHRKVDVTDLDVDFLAFSGHKIYGPTGIGVLYGKREWLEKLPPYHGGGEMIQHVSWEKTTYNELPYKYEAGTPDFINSVALAESINYVSNIGLDKIQAYESMLLSYATEKMLHIDGLKIYGTSADKEAVISFLVEGVHPYDLGVLLDQQGVAIRTGHHCAQPLMQRFSIEGTARISFGLYNTKQEVESFIKALKKSLIILG